MTDDKPANVIEALRCKRCGEDKAADEMKRDKRYASGFSSYCKRCHSAAARDWQRRNPERFAAANRASKVRRRDEILAKNREWSRNGGARIVALRKYKVTPAWYDATLAAQGGGCAICGRADPGARAFSVDHDHRCCPKTPTCGRCNRGLLCQPCNTAIAAWDTRPDWFSAAQAYLERAR